MDSATLRQLLVNAGCNDETATSILSACAAKQFDHALWMMKHHRCQLMDELHTCGKKVDSIDLLIRDINNRQK